MTRVINERSAGGVLLLPIGPALLVALICLRGGAILALPKGHIEDGESREQAAIRETREETGMMGTPLAPLTDISYIFRSRHHGARVAKRVNFFLMAYRSGSPARHDGEVDGVRLLPIERAEGALSYPGERAVMGEALAWVRAAGYGGQWAKVGPDRSP